MPAWAKAAVDHWTATAGIAHGRLFRALSQTGELGASLTAQAVYLIVKGYTGPLGIKAAPHDLRRYAVFRTMPNMVSSAASASPGCSR